MKDCQTLHVLLDTNQSKGAALVLMFFISQSQYECKNQHIPGK